MGHRDVAQQLPGEVIVGPADAQHRALVIHAYSAENVGDGLLVELTVDLINQALPDTAINVVANEADTFKDPSVTQWRPIGFPRLTSNPLIKRVGFILTIATGAAPEIRRLARDADVIVAVGGGYLRGDTAKAAFTSLGAHYGQLRLAARHGKKSVYLSQSIGPFAPSYWRLIRSRLRRVSAIFVRDDRTAALCATVPAAVRAPDLAVLEFAEKFGEMRTPTPDRSRLTVVARDLVAPRSYYDTVGALAEDPRTEFAVQSSIGGNNDVPMSERLAGRPVRSLAEILAESQPHVVISTRLHGSMAALLAGHPSIHLSYERKGWGAFEDLGLSEYVLNARGTSDDEVLQLVDRIHNDPEAYWSRAASRLAEISKYRSDIVGAIVKAGSP